MRTAILTLAFMLLPVCVHAATIGDCDGKWVVDLVATSEKSPGMKPDEELLSLTFIIDAKAKTMSTEFPGRPGSPKAFTVEREDASGLIVKRADGKILKLQPDGKGGLSVGEFKDQQLRRVLYLVRPLKSASHSQVRDKTLPARPRPAASSPAGKTR